MAPAKSYSTFDRATVHQEAPAQKIPQTHPRNAVPRDKYRVVRAVLATAQGPPDHSINPDQSHRAPPLTAAQTRITSKYTILRPTARKIKKQERYAAKKAARPADPSRPAPSEPTAEAGDEAKATFVLKTYDPDSGTCLQYQTTKAAEVGRLIGSLGRLGRHMAALPEAMEDLSAPADATGVSTPKIKVDEDVKTGGIPPESKAGGGGKKKKKGKK